MTNPTHTLATMDVPASLHAIVQRKLEAAGYGHAVLRDEGMLDMTGIALTACPRTTCWWHNDNWQPATLEDALEQMEEMRVDWARLATLIGFSSYTDLDNIFQCIERLVEVEAEAYPETALRLTGKLVQVSSDDGRLADFHAAIQADGEMVEIAGLTRNEARHLRAFVGQRVALSISALGQPDQAAEPADQVLPDIAPPADFTMPPVEPGKPIPIITEHGAHPEGGADCPICIAQDQERLQQVTGWTFHQQLPEPTKERFAPFYFERTIGGNVVSLVHQAAREWPEWVEEAARDCNYSSPLVGMEIAHLRKEVDRLGHALRDYRRLAWMLARSAPGGSVVVSDRLLALTDWNLATLESIADGRGFSRTWMAKLEGQPQPPVQGIDLGQLQRYDLDEGFDHYRGLTKDKGAHLYVDATGEWVKWEDVEALIGQRDAPPAVAP